MRDPKRIPELLSLIQEVWEKHPDLRLCQLLSNVTKHSGCWRSDDLFYFEDNSLKGALKNYDSNTTY